MLRWVILSVIVVVLTASAALVVHYGAGSSSTFELPSASRNQGPQPKVEIDGPLTYEFGNMATQKTGTHTWVIRNRGQADLELTMLGSNCQCTIAKFKKGEKAVVPPGETTEITLEWKTNDSVGDYAKSATIGTNDPGRPEFKLSVRGQVHMPVVHYPPDPVIQMGTISNEEPGRATVAVFSLDRPELQITRISSSKPDLIVGTATPLSSDETRVLKVQAGHRVDLEVLPGMTIGNFRDEVVIETDHPDQPKLTLTLVGSVTGPISIVPSKLQMISVKSREGATQQVTLLVRQGRPTNFEVAHKPEKLEVSIVPNDTPTLKGRYRLTVTVPPGTAAGLVDDQIILKTDHPNAGELKIPVNILVSAG
jgi:hypothetical protein